MPPSPFHADADAGEPILFLRVYHRPSQPIIISSMAEAANPEGRIKRHGNETRNKTETTQKTGRVAVLGI
jgi:hypothetical protein